jgi:hypothetical protein
VLRYTVRVKHIFLLVVLVVTIGLGIICVTRPVALTDVTSDLFNDPNSVRGQLKTANADLEVSHQKIQDLSTKCEQLSEEIGDLKNQILQAKITASPQVVSAPSAYQAPNPLPARPNWSWSVLGKDYQNVVVTSADADTVSITYDGGAGTIQMLYLPPDIQRMMNYDPQLAAAATKQKASRRSQIDSEQAPKIAALLEEKKAQEANDDAQAAEDERAVQARAEASHNAEVKRVVAADVASDLAYVSKHISINPTTGQVSGNAYFVQKYYQDQQAIQSSGR